MKKILSLLIIICVALTLCACGKTTEFVSQVHEIEAESAEREARIEFSEDETEAMLNFMIGNRYVWNGNRLFGLAHDADGNEFLCSMSRKMRKMDVIDRGADCMYLTLDGGYLYYNCGGEAICRVKEDLSEAVETLYEGPCGYLQLFNGRLYFTSGEEHLASIPLTGGKARTEYAEHTVFYPYLWGDYLFFQNGDDGETLCSYNFETGEEKTLEQGPVYEYIWKGENLSPSIGKYAWNEGDGTAYLYVTKDVEVIATLKDGEYLIDYITVHYLDDGSEIVIPRGE